MPARDDMDLCTDKVLSKGRILQELTKAVKLVYAQSLHGTVVLDGDSWLVYWLDRALRHGLRVERHGYWGTARELSHQDTVVVIHALQSVFTSIGKGRAWLYHTLSEASFESYLACLLRDWATLKKQYFPHALVRDADKTHQLINLLAGLENVSFTLQLDVTYLDICNYMPQKPMSGSPSGTALSLHLRSSSVSSSLASPGDSGLALDSDMDAANETDTSSYKEEDSSIDDIPKYRSIKYGRGVSKSCDHKDNENIDRCFSSSDSSEDGKTPVHSPIVLPKFNKTQIKNSDIVNQNNTMSKRKMDDNEVSCCSSLDTLKDYNMYGKLVVEESSRLDKPTNDNDNDNSNPEPRENNRINRSSRHVGGNSYSFKKTMDSRNSYVINNDTNLLELSMTISDCDCCTETPYSILNTINMTDGSGGGGTSTSTSTTTSTSTSILSSSGLETVGVQRRPRKKKRGDTKKRVSFHEDILKTMKLEDDENYTDFSISFLQPNSVERKDTQKGRYSWCGNGDSPYVEKHVPTRNAHSDYYCSSSSFLGLYDTERNLKMREMNNGDNDDDENDDDDDDGEIEKNSKVCVCKLAMSERGVPEGQEDPGFNSIPKMEIELEENEAQEAYAIERQYGYIVEDPLDPDVEMLPFPNPNPNPNPNEKGHDRKYASSSDWSDVESTTTSTDVDERKNSRHLASPLKKRNITSVLSSETSKLIMGPFRQTPSKSSLLNRFLRSITERKFDVKKKDKCLKPCPLYIKGAKPDYHSFKDFNDNVEKEIQDNIVADKREFSGEKISLKLREIFKRHIYRDKTEELYKVYKVRSSYMNNGDSRPMLALLTDKTLYLTGSKSDNNCYSNQFVIPYNELDVIMIGPNGQTILISNADYEMQYLFSTGCSQTTSELIAHLEISMRRSPSNPKLPAVKQLGYDEMHTLKHSILSETTVHPDEKIKHYSLIYMEDEHISPPSTPCGPTKEGDLMFRTHSYEQPNKQTVPTNSWQAGYFVLKAGVVYMFTDSNQRLPNRAIPLKGGLCQGCRRIPNCHRPHTFEILINPNKAFQFAAPDEYVASEWLQSFVQSASGLFDCSQTDSPLPCTLVATTRHLVAMKEFFPGTRRGQTLSCASVEDLTAFRVPLAQQSWCILEFACREVHESSGDWVIYFTNYTELCAFREILETLWADAADLGEFPMVTLPPDDKLHRRCSDASKHLEYAWKYLLLPVASE